MLGARSCEQNGHKTDKFAPAGLAGLAFGGVRVPPGRVLGTSWPLLGASWPLLGASWALLGRLLGAPGCLRAALGRLLGALPWISPPFSCLVYCFLVLQFAGALAIFVRFALRGFLLHLCLACRFRSSCVFVICSFVASRLTWGLFCFAFA